MREKIDLNRLMREKIDMNRMRENIDMKNA